MKYLAAFAVGAVLAIGGCANSAAVNSPSQKSVSEAGASNSLLDAGVQCSFGDADACKQVDSQAGGADGAIEHDAMIREQLKSPEQRQKDLYGP